MLKSVDRDTYGDGYDTTLLEQWKTCVEMANSNTEKRNNANSLFITINAALFTVVTFAGDYKSILLSAIGIVVCILWLTSIRSYRHHNSKICRLQIELNAIKLDKRNALNHTFPILGKEWQEKKHSNTQIQQGVNKILEAGFFLPAIFLGDCEQFVG